MSEPTDQAPAEDYLITSIEAAEAPNVSEIYANNVGLAITPFEFTFHFGTVGEVRKNKQSAPVHRKVTVIVSPEIAKGMYLQLAQGIQGFEQAHRAILWPPKGDGSAKSKT